MLFLYSEEHGGMFRDSSSKEIQVLTSENAN